jgi:hypothetical protein
MALTLVNGADLGNNGGAGSLSTNYTVGSGSNCVVIGIEGDFVSSSGGGNFDDLTTVNFGGNPMSLATKLIDNSSPSSPRYTYLYYALGISAGSNAVLISSTNNHYIGALILECAGVKQTGQPDATTTNVSSSSGANLATSITTIADNCEVIILALGGSPSSACSAVSGNIALSVFGAQFNQPTFLSSFSVGGPVHPAGLFTFTTSSGNANSIGHIVMSIAPDTATPTAQNKDSTGGASWQKRVVRGDASRTTRWTRKASGLFVPRGLFPLPA